MDLLRVDVVPRGNGYLAKCLNPEIAAVGASPSDAAENARQTAIAAVPKSDCPSMLLVRIQEPGRSTIIMQSMYAIVSLDNFGNETPWRYLASVGDNRSAEVAE